MSTNAGRRIAANSIWNLAAFCCGILAHLVTIPFVIARLGIEAFGIAGLVVAIVAPFLLVGMTLGQAVARDMAAQLARGDGRAARRTVGTAVTLLGVVIAGGGLILVTIVPTVAATIFHLPEGELRTALAIATASWAAMQVSAVLQGMHVAAQAYRRIAQINALGALALASFVFTLVDAMPSLDTYLAAMNAGLVVTLAAWLVSASRLLPGALARPAWDRTVLRSLLAFGGWQMTAQLVGLLSTQIDRYLLGAFTSPAAVGTYNVAQRAEEAAYVGVLKAGEVLFPVFSAGAAEAPALQAQRLLRAAWLLNVLAACVLAPFITLADQVLLVWIGPEGAGPAADVLRVLAVAGLVGCAVNALNFYLLGTGRTRDTAALAFVSASVSCLASAALVPRYGLAAAGIGAVAGMMVQAATALWLIRRIFGRDAQIGWIAHAHLVPVGTGIAVGWALRGVFPPLSSWPALVLAFTAAAGCVGGAILLAAMAGRHRAVCLADLRSILGRFLPAGTPRAAGG